MWADSYVSAVQDHAACRGPAGETAIYNPGLGMTIWHWKCSEMTVTGKMTHGYGRLLLGWWYQLHEIPSIVYGEPWEGTQRMADALHSFQTNSWFIRLVRHSPSMHSVLCLSLNDSHWWSIIHSRYSVTYFIRLVEDAKYTQSQNFVLIQYAMDRTPWEQ